MRTDTMDMRSFFILKSLRLLYVEDDQPTREELAMMLEPWLGALYVATDGQAGLELFKSEQPNIVVTDIQMPVLSGLAMSGEIRRLNTEVPIVIISAYNDTEYLFRAIELGIDQYLTKPIHIERLLNKLVQIATVVKAVQERQRNQLLLEQYKYLVDQSAVLCKLTPEGRITYVNERFCDISGYGQKELIGLPIDIIRHPSESPELGRTIFTILAGGEKWSGIIKNRTRDGEMYVVESSLVPILNEQREVTEIVVLDVDLTDIHRNYQGLVESLRQSDYSLEELRHFLGEYKRALELGACLCVTDPQWRILSTNWQFDHLLGFMTGELLGQSLGWLTGEQPDKLCPEIAQSLRNGRLISHVMNFQHKQGQVKQFSVACLGVRDLDGAIDSIIMICKDITESLQLKQDIIDTQRQLLYMMGDVVENRSLETAEHVRRVALVSKFLALKYGLGMEFAEMIEMAAPMHDVGKVGIRDAILHKVGSLTQDEFEEMKLHTRIGRDILGKVEGPLFVMAATIAYQHHERYDGLGYPEGLQGEEIAIEGRIVAIADVLDALSSPRSYKRAWNEEQVRRYFHQERGRQFDPELVERLLAHWETVMALRNDFGET